ncbi:tyrosine-type recombinase/integrase [Lentzea aerocolonigenes]|uniref:tyrosine-type recombinase/integrase n=1 Tax=Lentzea aerocolonigenes TaxID=68170 RepID=UPI000B24D4F7|nr:site-specific integrase [Lentzea aerocolonigenes]MCP2245756.1 Site-specific recombinase XerD [Lentzea aerocolonigenes]
MARRGTNGEGSIYQRKTDKRWEASLWIASASGVRKRVRVYGSTRREAHAKLVELKAKQQQGIPAPDKAWKLGAYLDYWLEAHVKPTKRPKTYESYEISVRLYLKPLLGHFSLTKLTVANVQKSLNAMVAAGSSVRKAQIVRTTLSAALTRAMREDLLMRNVARLVELKDEEKEEVEPWSLEEARQFLAAARQHVLYPAFLMPLLYSMRRGEVLGLRWSDIDFASGTIQVRQQLQRVGRELVVGPVKTNSGRRDLLLLDELRAALLEYNAYRQSVSRGSDLAFITAVGTPIEPRNFVRAWWRLCNKAGVRVIRFHDQRHTTSTLLAELGVQPKVAQKILGHASVITTMNIYTHARQKDKEEAISRIGAALLAKPKDHAPRLRGLVGDARSRQSWPSAADFVARITSIISGGPSGNRTQDTLLKSSIEAPLQLRLTEVNWVAERATRRWKLGLVAVNLAVRSTYEQAIQAA